MEMVVEKERKTVFSLNPVDCACQDRDCVPGTSTAFSYRLTVTENST